LVPITFDESDFQVRDFSHFDAFIATANVAGYTLHNILIDIGSSVDILFIKAFKSMGLDKRTLEPAGSSLFGFGGKKIDAIGKKAIPISFEEGERVRTEMIMFDIVNMDYPYMAIFGRGFTNKFEVIIKQSYLCMKMPSPFGIIIVYDDQLASRCIEGKPTPGYNLVNEVAKKLEEIERNNEKMVSPRAETGEDTQKTPLTEAVLDKCVHIGTNLSDQEK
jgi:hypothetical protein